MEADPLSAFELQEELGVAYQVLIARNLHEAFACLDAHDEDIAAIVTDVLVAAKSGLFQRPKAIWDRVPNAARIVVTATEQEASRSMTGVSTIAQASAVVPRPWLPGDLRAAVARVLGAS